MEACTQVRSGLWFKMASWGGKEREKISLLDQEPYRIFPVTHMGTTGSNPGLIWICAFILRGSESPPTGGLSQYAHMCVSVGGCKLKKDWPTLTPKH